MQYSVASIGERPLPFRQRGDVCQGMQWPLISLQYHICIGPQLAPSICNIRGTCRRAKHMEHVCRPYAALYASSRGSSLHAVLCRPYITNKAKAASLCACCRISSTDVPDRRELLLASQLAGLLIAMLPAQSVRGFKLLRRP